MNSKERFIYKSKQRERKKEAERTIDGKFESKESDETINLYKLLIFLQNKTKFVKID